MEFEIKNKIQKIYKKNKIKVSDEYIENATKDKKRVKNYMRLYKEEEIDSMNYILGKPLTNKTFTKFELEAMSKIDLFDRKLIEICKIIWENRNNPEKLDQFLQQLNIEIENIKKEAV